MQQRVNGYQYSVYGMNINSPIPLKGLAKTEAKPDVNIRFGRISNRFLKEKLPASRRYEKLTSVVEVSPTAMFYQWQEIGKAFIENGEEVIIESKKGTLKEDISPFLTGLILGVLLHQRGYFVLHASAVNINGVTVAFLGDKGYGKSTLAAHLQVRGHNLVSDDLVPVTFEEDGIYTTPGFPRIKLYEDSIAAVGSNPDSFPLIHRAWKKRAFQCIEDFSTSPVKLDCLCVLDKADEVEISALSRTVSFIEITKNTYLHLYLDALNYQTEQFKNSRRLIQSLPVVTLKRPPSFEKMSEVIEALENLASEIGSNRKTAKAA